ncbi:dipeptidase [Methylosinus sp. Sm6]|uniref:dipeptidase n=1 Tax=Methylosinus sp. Sm6 TaxID=2866948 RepID=UPI001C9A1377|nr:dipeptidase [Methylosinus sp. Sm6]MBY6242636.1 dipeptidase [Methylosinus sp. Sm6]
MSEISSRRGARASHRRRLSNRVLAAAVTTLVFVTPPARGDHAADPATAAADSIHKRVLTLDSHVDIPFEFMSPQADPGRPSKMQVDLPKMREGGLGAAFFIVYVGQAQRTAETYEQARSGAETKFAAIHKMVETYPEQIELATRAGDVARIRANGKLVALIGVENGFVIGKDLSLLQRYHDLGARYFGLVHAGHNDLGDSANPISWLDNGPEHNGLSPLGREAVVELNRLGIIVDISHASKETSLQAIELSRAPVIASHSDVGALNPISRNLDDETLEALARKGGVAQIVAFDSYLWVGVVAKHKAQEALRREYGIDDPFAVGKLPPEKAAEYFRRLLALDQVWARTDVKRLVDHIDHAVAKIGVDHVGLASDFGGGGGIVGWKDASETYNVTRELARRGYSEQDIAKLWGGNLLRVLAKVEEIAEKSRD